VFWVVVTLTGCYSRRDAETDFDGGQGKRASKKCSPVFPPLSLPDFLRSWYLETTISVKSLRTVIPSIYQYKYIIRIRRRTAASREWLTKQRDLQACSLIYCYFLHILFLKLLRYCLAFGSHPVSGTIISCRRIPTLLNAPQNCFATTSDLTSSRAVLRRRTVSDTPGTACIIFTLVAINKCVSSWRGSPNGNRSPPPSNNPAQ